jgi:hypothetical protein
MLFELAGGVVSEPQRDRMLCIGPAMIDPFREALS